MYFLSCTEYILAGYLDYESTNQGFGYLHYESTSDESDDD